MLYDLRPTPANDFEPLLRINEVVELTTLSRRTIYRKIKQGEFPRGAMISTNLRRWRRSEIAHWLTEAIAA